MAYTTEGDFLTVSKLEAQNQAFGIWVASETSFVAIFSVSSYALLFAQRDVCVLIYSSYEDTGHTGVEPT